MIECTTAFWLGLSLLGVFEHSQAILAITNRWFTLGPVVLAHLRVELNK